MSLKKKDLTYRVFNKDLTYRVFNKELKTVGKKLRNATFPGFEKVPIYNVFWFFIHGIRKGSLNVRATSIAFNFLLALGPALIFFLTILPYLPIENFQDTLQDILFRLMPENSYIAIEPILDEVFMRRGGLPIFGLLTSLFFAQKGMHGIIETFNATYHTLETRSWHQQRLISIALVFIIYSLIAVVSLVYVMSKTLLNSFIDLSSYNINNYLIFVGKWIMLIAITFFSISFLYYLGPSRRTKWKFFSAGSSLATFLTIITSLGFTYFMDHFAQLNKFFGSIGAIIALMLWMNFNALTLLIGFELNVSISHAQFESLDE